MREIKFRLWCKNKNEWEKDLWWIGCDGNLYTVINGQLRSMKKETHLLCQFTGLFDKNGKEIYEGDILERYNSCVAKGEKPYVRSVVSWDIWHWEGIRGWRESEVIGNIFENPELLEKKP